jgi:hypothetical protein
VGVMEADIAQRQVETSAPQLSLVVPLILVCDLVIVGCCLGILVSAPWIRTH